MGSVTRSVDGGAQTSTGGASATFTVSGDSAGHTVLYRGTDAAGNTGTDASQTIRIDGTAPTTVGGLSSRPGGGAGVTIDLAWTAATDATSGVQGYEVRWTDPVASCPAASAASYPNSATIGAATSYTIAGLSKTASYCAYLVTIDNAGNRGASSVATGPTKAK